MLNTILAGLVSHLPTGLLLASAEGEAVPSIFWDRLWGGFVLALVFGLLGITLMALGFKVFEWITPKLDIEKELGEKHNIAVAVVCAAVILAIALIVAVVIK
jgi:putative membrane protein